MNIDLYLEMLQSEAFKPGLAVMKVKGMSSLQFTACSNGCENRPGLNKYEVGICNKECELANNQRIVTGLGRERGNCGKAKDPSSCVKKIDSKINATKEKITKNKAQLEKMKKSKFRFAAQVAGGLGYG